MHVVIATVSEVHFDGEAYSLTVPASEGEMTILAEHMPVITTLKAGTVTVREAVESESKTFPIEGGVLEVRRDGVTVIL